MLEKLEKWFFGFWIKNYRVSFLLIFLIILSWAFSLISIPKESSPDIKFGIISINTVYRWVNPADIDNLITDEIEKAIKNIEGIKSINSNSSIGVSSITVELENGINTQNVLTDIKDKVDNIEFPEDAQDSSIIEISTTNELMFQLLLYGDSDSFSNFYLNLKAQELKNALEGKGGISSIDLWWVSWQWSFAESSSVDDYEIEVLLSRKKIQELWLSIRDIANTIRTNNKNTPIWNYFIWDLSYDFRFKWELETIDDLKNIIISSQNNSTLKLSDISEINLAYPWDNIYSVVFPNQSGYNYVSLDFNKKAGSNIFKNSESAKALIQDYISSHGIGFQWLDYRYTKDTGDLIKEDYGNLSRTALQTLFLVFITILLFVGLRESLIATILLPLSFLITFTVLNTLGLSLNFLTNFSLVLTLWIAIDTIIVIIEWSAERSRLWYSRAAAVLLATKDLKAPLISGTMTTLVAFLPMIFLPGITGKFLSYIPTTVFATLLAALLLSLTVSSALFLKLTKKLNYYHEDKSFEMGLTKKEKKFLDEQREWKTQLTKNTLDTRWRFLGKLGNFYFKILHSFLEHSKTRIIAIVLPILILISTFVFLSPQIGFTLFPAGDNSVLNINISAPTGSSEKLLEQYLDDVESVLMRYSELELANITISWNTMSIYLELVDTDQRDRNVFELESSISQELWFLVWEWLKFEIQAQEWWPPVGKAVWIQLIASNTNAIDSLTQVSKDFEQFLKNLAWTKNISSSSSDTPGQFVFEFDKDKLGFIWLNPDDLLTEISIYTSGITAGSITSKFEDNDIRLKIWDFDTHLSPSDIENLVIETRVGPIRVGDFANYEFGAGLSSISREDTRITIRVESDLDRWVLPTSIQPQLIAFAKQYNYPNGISFIAWGENQENAELIASTIASFAIALFLIFSILVFQFNSFSRPVIIIYSVVLALLWVNVGLYVTGNPYSMPFAIGFIALTWVVVNDAIIFVDRMMKNIAKLERNNDNPDKQNYLDAISAAGKSRLQPIIVTTLTTVFWVLPLALQDEFWAGLGFTIIFWLFAGSTMTLFIIPALYYQVYLRKKWSKINK